jgi:hypothetical protein
MNNLALNKIDEISSSSQFAAEMDKTTHDILPVAIAPDLQRPI